jgi:hypothetical protein
MAIDERAEQEANAPYLIAERRETGSNMTTERAEHCAKQLPPISVTVEGMEMLESDEQLKNV